MTKRRDFLKTSALGATGITLGAIGASAKSYGSIMGANDRFRIAVCGVNGRGKSHIKGFSNLKNVEIAYLVDPDSTILTERVNQLKGQEEGISQKVKGIGDVREVLDMKDIDAISCATPNHWHSQMVIWSAQAKKHCYVEKPASHDIYEGRVALEATKKYGIVVQHGTQRRSQDNWARQVSDIRSGKYGKMTVSHGFACKPRQGIGFASPSEPPANLDWDHWKGPAVIDRYHSNLVHYNWHWFWQTGNGELNNQGTHQLDVAYWALDKEVENTHPRRVMAIGGRFNWEDQGETPNTMFALAEFANGQYVFFNVRNVNYEGYERQVTNHFYFEDGGKLVNGTYESHNGSQPRNVPIKEVTITPGGNYGSFVAACRANDPDMANGTMQDAHYSCTLGHLMNNSYRLGKVVPFNEKAGKFGDNQVAFEEFMKIHSIAKGGMGVPVDKAEYIVGPWLEFDGETEMFVGDQSVEANRLLRDPRNQAYDIPSIQTV
jgi:predicted dehydrogenase